MVEGILNEINADEKYRENSLNIRLEGLCHTDDRIAFLHIAEQLNYDPKSIDNAIPSGEY